MEHARLHWLEYERDCPHITVTAQLANYISVIVMTTVRVITCSDAQRTSDLVNREEQSTGSILVPSTWQVRYTINVTANKKKRQHVGQMQKHRNAGK